MKICRPTDATRRRAVSFASVEFYELLPRNFVAMDCTQFPEILPFGKFFRDPEKSSPVNVPSSVILVISRQCCSCRMVACHDYDTTVLLFPCHVASVMIYEICSHVEMAVASLDKLLLTLKCLIHCRCHIDMSSLSLRHSCVVSVTDAECAVYMAVVVFD